MVNGIFLLRLPFPDQNSSKKEDNNFEEAKATTTIKSNFYIEGFALIVIGFTSTATFQIFLNVNKSFSIATFSVTAIAGFITSKFGIEYTLLMAGAVTGIGALLSVIVNFIYNILAKQTK